MTNSGVSWDARTDQHRQPAPRPQVKTRAHRRPKGAQTRAILIAGQHRAEILMIRDVLLVDPPHQAPAAQPEFPNRTLLLQKLRPPSGGLFFSANSKFDQSSARASARDMPATSMASVAAIRPSRSPSSTPCVSDVSNPVRRSFTI